MSVDELRAARGKAVAVFTEFTRLYKKHDESALYCFFEGEDSKYYGIRIKNVVRPEKYEFLSCKGKDGVLGIYKMLSSRKYYDRARKAYFVDKDFDKSIDEIGIYETPCHSVENFYTSIECFKNILKSEFHLTEADENFERSVKLYIKLQEQFHNSVELLNAWIACHINRSSGLNVSDINFSKLVRIDLTKASVNYTLDDLCNKFPHLPAISQQELDAKKVELRAKVRQKSFRGKFEIEFLFSFLHKLINEANEKSSPYFTRKIKVVLKLSRGNTISDLSQYADTPKCLYSYLDSLRVDS
ncbi:MAG: DUF4435 domain-containing protein [Oscillatoria sp. SIO1A7]|nr:DUF4435 domain-containing protein [Oscillatoria sp. SIO1A7]